MATNEETIKQLRRRVDELTGQLEQSSSGRVDLEFERNALARTVRALTGELEAVRAELADVKQERPALTFDQLGTQLREGLSAVEKQDGQAGPRYQTNAASFELKVAIDSDGEKATLRLPRIGDAVDPGILGTFRLDVGRAADDDPDLSGLVLVPTLAGATEAGAADRLDRAGLTVGQTTARPAGGPPGSVVDQDPEGGSYVEPGTAIDVVLAATEVEVPDVAGTTVERAKPRLAAVRLEVGEITSKPSTDVEAGTIIGQNPRAGATAAIGSSVDLTIASPPARTVPDLAGLTVDEASGRLADGELTLGRVVERVGTEPPGRIVGQEPRPGTEVARGSAVGVVVAKAPVRRAVRVPDVVGQPRPKAIDVLAGENFGARITGTRSFADGDDPADFDTVVAQEPDAGTLTTEPTVDLTVVASGESTEVLRGIGPAMVRRLAAAGLATVGDVAHAEVERIAEAMGTSVVRAAAVLDEARERNKPGS